MTTSVTTAVPQTKRSTSARITDVLIQNIMIVVMLLIVAFFAYRSARFATPDNLLTILIAAAPFALIALGQTLVILTGGIDLSVGSVIAASAMAAAWTAKNVGDNPALPLIAAVATGLIAGAINGFVVSRMNVPPFIATLGMLTLASGIAYVIGGGAPINGLPSSYGVYANTSVFGLTIPVILMIAAILAFAFIMKRTSYGLRVYAVGGNLLAAEIAGVRSKSILFSVYAISGLLAGLSGLMLSSRVITGAPNLGQGYELDAIAAVVIGGASLMGGRGTIWGTAIGLLLIQTINNGLDLLLVPAYWQNVIKGVIIVAAVAVDVWAAKRRK
ncbi:ribose transport system permease protein [Microbacterium sp. W4I4]|uniref:ABC transporter permease n=1 Tax=Microbacterium sp. W4I4 TaxID=3042295 RepID=UPI00278688CB|nr:ABC transporter permease [Microbacterium sp. W4I4]MDQ0613943.1 ribose transport system permease protein [Microbacterium sp. W4I4]